MYIAPTRTVFGFPQLFLLIVIMLFIVPTTKIVAAEPLLNINTANPEMLADALPGIGPSKARAIVLYREQNGPFKTVDQLIEVKGIGAGTLEKIRPLVYVNLNDILKSSTGLEGTGTSTPTTSSNVTQLELERTTRKAVRAAIKFAQQYQSK